MKYKILVKTKLLDGKYLEMRSHELGKSDLKVVLCSSKNYQKCYHIREPFMTLSLAKQKTGKIVNTQRSKFYPYAYYKMISFLWKPKGENENEVLSDKKVTYEGGTAIIG